MRARARGAFAIGLLHWAGGSAGRGVLLLASIQSPLVAIGACAIAPSLGAASLAFGLWYATAAWSFAPYPS